MSQSIFRYCPNCKSEDHSFTNYQKFLCNTCNFQYFHNVASAVMVFLKCKDEVLFVRRNNNPKKGLLDLPGGFVDPTENAQDAAIREIKEELNLDLKPKQLKIQTTESNDYTYRDVLYYTVDIVYFIELDKKPKINLCEEELQEVLWLDPKKVEPTDLAFESAKKIVKELF